MPMPASFAPTQSSSRNRRAAKKPKRSHGGWVWLRGLLDRRLRIERRGLQIHILFEKPAAAPSSSESSGGSGSALRRDHLALQALFELRPELRLTMRSLAYVEDAMALRGSRALKGMPPKLYAKALKYLEKAMQMEPGVKFPELERRLRVASQARPVVEVVEFTTAVQVTEASHSLFDEMERSWTGEIPPSIFDSRLAEEGSSPER